MVEKYHLYRVVVLLYWNKIILYVRFKSVADFRGHLVTPPTKTQCYNTICELPQHIREESNFSIYFRLEYYPIGLNKGKKLKTTLFSLLPNPPLITAFICTKNNLIFLFDKWICLLENKWVIDSLTNDDLDWSGRSSMRNCSFKRFPGIFDAFVLKTGRYIIVDFMNNWRFTSTNAFGPGFT